MSEHAHTAESIAKAARQARYTKDQTEALLWLNDYWINQLYTNNAELCHLLDYDWTVVSRVWQGKYPGKIDPFIDRVVGLRRRIQSLGFDRFVDTQVTAKIFSRLNSLQERPGIGMIVGPTGRSKTHTLRTWARMHPGRVFMIEAPPFGGTKAFLEALAAKMGLPKNRPAWQQRQSISAKLHAENVVIVDEATRLTSGRNVQTLEVLRSFNDEQGASVVVCLTRFGKSEVQNGANSGYLEQLVGRTAWTVDIPEAVTVQEAKAVVAHYLPVGVEPPADLVGRVHRLANAGNTAGLEEMGRLRVVFSLLDDAKTLVADGAHLELKHLEAAILHRSNQSGWQS